MEPLVEENGAAGQGQGQGQGQGGQAGGHLQAKIEQREQAQGQGQAQAQAQAQVIAEGSQGGSVGDAVQLTLHQHGHQPHQAQVQSVIQSNSQSVIQPTAAVSPLLNKTNVILVSKPGVIHATQATLQTLQIKPEPRLVGDALQPDSGSDDSMSDDESPKKRRDLLTRRPSYRKILSDLGGAEIAEGRLESNSSECESEVSLPPPLPFPSVIPAGALQNDGGGGGLHTLTMSNAGSGGAIVQYATTQDGQFYVPVQHGGPVEDQTRKREIRLLKNREAARECRRKKKEYIKCLENRVTVLENQNKALIDELKSLKELYCKQKLE